ncbi:uncharacterized protein LOC131009780 [Salvia miltiorrhiza]|uniref:uncharacterized protein LOC131009780 n=1 Tax=Salvia miltiorrhiza TaxID=226208 RepID=UPI0025ABBD3F|nr:uncharacterized protein LOC131009780 [Salvia miltiorrhiza]
MGEKPTSLVFPRLFSLCVNKNASIEESGRWAGGTWVWEFQWRRELFEWEKEMANALTVFISECVPNAGKKDEWRWKRSKDGRFSTKSAFETFMESRNVPPSDPESNTLLAKVWDAPTPHKVQVTAWRCLRNRLATCDNLVKRKVGLEEGEEWCNGCIWRTETADHLFLLCPKAQQVWDALERWMVYSSASPSTITQHFTLFINRGRGKRTENLLKALWMCTIWLLWKRRNESRFEGKVWEVQNLIAEIKGRVWSWLVIFNGLDTDVSFQVWCSREFSLSSYFNL